MMAAAERLGVQPPRARSKNDIKNRTILRAKRSDCNAVFGRSRPRTLTTVLDVQVPLVLAAGTHLSTA